MCVCVSVYEKHKVKGFIHAHIHHLLTDNNTSYTDNFVNEQIQT